MPCSSATALGGDVRAPRKWVRLWEMDEPIPERQIVLRDSLFLRREAL